MSTENYSLLNQKVDCTSLLWKKKYTMLLKRTENVEKQNLRLINRLYEIKKISRRLNKEKKFLLKRLDRYGDDYRNTKFFIDSELLPGGSTDSTQKMAEEVVQHSPERLPGMPPKKPMSAFFRYCQAQHLQILKENSGLSHDQIKKNLAENWEAMSAVDKEEYYEAFEEDRDKYEKEMNGFLLNFKENAETITIKPEPTEATEPNEEELTDVSDTKTEPEPVVKMEELSDDEKIATEDSLDAATNNSSLSDNQDSFDDQNYEDES